MTAIAPSTSQKEFDLLKVPPVSRGDTFDQDKDFTRYLDKEHKAVARPGHDRRSRHQDAPRNERRDSGKTDSAQTASAIKKQESRAEKAEKTEREIPSVQTGETDTQDTLELWTAKGNTASLSRSPEAGLEGDGMQETMTGEENNTLSIGDETVLWNTENGEGQITAEQDSLARNILKEPPDGQENNSQNTPSAQIDVTSVQKNKTSPDVPEAGNPKEAVSRTMPQAAESTVQPFVHEEQTGETGILANKTALKKPSPSLGKQAVEKLAAKTGKNTPSSPKEGSAFGKATADTGSAPVKTTLQPSSPQQLLAGVSATPSSVFDAQNPWAMQGPESAQGASTSASNMTPLRLGTMPAQAPPGQTLPTAITLQISKNLQKGINRFEIRLDPPELGRVEVRMSLSADGKVSTHLLVERAETLELLQRDARALEKSLEDAGLDTDSGTLSFSLKGEQEHFASDDDSSSQQTTRHSDTEQPENTIRKQNASYISAEGVDIRI